MQVGCPQSFVKDRNESCMLLSLKNRQTNETKHPLMSSAQKKNELSGLSLGVLSLHVQSSQFITGILTNKIRSVPHWHPEHVYIILLTYRLQYKHCFWDIQFQQATSNTFSFWTLPSFRTIKKKKKKKSQQFDSTGQHYFR